MLAHPAPGIERTAFAHAPGEQGAQTAAQGVEQPVHIGRNPLGQPVLQRLGGKRQQRAQRMPNGTAARGSSLPQSRSAASATRNPISG